VTHQNFNVLPKWNKTLFATLTAAIVIGLESRSLSADLEPVLREQYKFSGSAVTVAVAGDYAYVADYDAGLRVLSLANRGQPIEVGHLFTGQSTAEVQVVGNRAYVTGETSNFFVIDITDPSNPQQLSKLGIGGSPRSIVVSGHLAFVADFNTGLNIIDITDSSAPRRIGLYHPSDGNALRAAVSGDLAYVAVPHSGVHSLDISNPASPKLLGVYPLGTIVRNLAVAANLVYALDDDEGLLVVDFSDASNPQLIGSAALPGWGFFITLANNYAYVGLANGSQDLHEQGLQIFDISNPFSPEPAGGIQTSNDAKGVKVVGNLAYLCASNLLIFELTGLPVFTSRAIVQGKLSLTWNQAALGMTLQQTSTLTNPNWNDVQGTEGSSRVLLPLGDSAGFFRLLKR
jgi:hypothetical protein